MAQARVNNSSGPVPFGDLPSRKFATGERPSKATRKRDAIDVLFGTVTGVDSDRMLMRVTLTGDRNGDVISNVLITQPYGGTASFMSAVPEIGTKVVLIEANGTVYPITYVPSYKLGLRQEHVVEWDRDEVLTNDRNDHFYKFRKIGEGELCFSSRPGGEIFLGEDVTLSTSIGEHLKIRGEDNVMIQSSVNNYVFSSGVWSNSGIVQRNSIDSRIEGSFAKEARLNSGSVNFNLMPGASGESSDYFAEYRIEVEDFSKSDMPENDVLRSGGETFRNPIAIFSLGNMIGNNTHYKNSYGLVLKPTLFTDYNDDTGEFVLDVLTGDEPRTLGMAFSLFSPNRRNAELGAFFGADKEGHFYHYLPSGTGGGICPGRSLSLLAMGSKKEVWGSDSRYGNSWDMVLEGGVKWVVGSHSGSLENPHNSLSMDVTTDGGVYLKYGINQELGVLKEFGDSSKYQANLRKYKKIEIVAGCERKEVEMTRETIIEGSDLINITGKEERSICGSYNTNVGDSYNLSVGNTFNEKVSKEKQEGYGSRVTTITSGKSELRMMPINPAVKGNIEETVIGRGDRKVTLTAGDIDEKILVKGNRSFFATAGDFKVRTLKGNLSFNTVAGKVVLKTVAGMFEAKASLGMKLEAKAGKTAIKGMLVSLKGAGPGSSGVVTVLSHLDYVTGAPLRGSLTVKASL